MSTTIRILSSENRGDHAADTVTMLDAIDGETVEELVVRALKLGEDWVARSASDMIVIQLTRDDPRLEYRRGGF